MYLIENDKEITDSINAEINDIRRQLDEALDLIKKHQERIKELDETQRLKTKKMAWSNGRYAPEERLRLRSELF